MVLFEDDKENEYGKIWNENIKRYIGNEDVLFNILFTFSFFVFRAFRIFDLIPFPSLSLSFHSSSS